MTSRYDWSCPHCVHQEDADSLAAADLGYSHHLWTVHAIRRAEQPIPLEDVIPMTPDQVAWVRKSRGAGDEGGTEQVRFPNE